MDAYKKTVGGRLQLKGGVTLKPTKKPSKSKKRPRDSSALPDGASADAKRQRAAAAAAADAADEAQPLERKTGVGRIITSGTVVYGREGTKLMLELDPGDLIIVQHPTSLKEEMRVVASVLSDVSMTISSPFSTDLISATQFEFMKRPKRAGATEGQAPLPAAGTEAGTAGTAQTYRVKKEGAYGGYRLVTEVLDSGKSREELLELRCKRKADRHCY